jgi:molybdopterin/thiamine biosynthesis adenylyltransferase
MYHYDDRFKDAPWYEKSKSEQILVVGVGGIGGNAMYCLTKTIPAQYWIQDMDKVEEYNIGCQFFTKNQIGKFKVAAIQETVRNNTNVTINSMPSSYKNDTLPIMIAAVDNMKTRKDIFENWKKSSITELLIDGRLRANMYEVYTVTKDKADEYEKTLFEDSEVDDGPCTFKQTAYFGMLIGARITHLLVNYLTNKYAGEQICNVPFRVYEVGEPFLIEMT